MPTPDGSVAVVTGAAHGLGAAIAAALVAAGWRVGMMDIDASALETQAAALGQRAVPVPVDLTDEASTTRAMDAFLRDHGPTRYLVHNAAILVPEPFDTLDLERWRATLDVGLQAAFLLTKAVWPEMTRAGRGRIVLVSSRSGIEGFADETAYCAAKHGLEGFMKALALEGASRGIAVNTITPGMYMRTPMSERNYPAEAKAKWVEPSELAPAFVHLGSLPSQARNGERLDAWQISRDLAEEGRTP